MFQLGKTIVSEDIIEKEFVCNLASCKGACCIEGEAGAPLTEEEVLILKNIYPKVEPYLRPEGIKAIEDQGLFITTEGEYETTLIDDKDCAYVIFDKNNTAKCGIEDAYNQGVIKWKKPISCHLYPIRIQKLAEYQALNYDRWTICSDACSHGKELGVPIYKFLRDPLIRKFGTAWYTELEKEIDERKLD